MAATQKHRTSQSRETNRLRTFLKLSILFSLCAHIFRFEGPKQGGTSGGRGLAETDSFEMGRSLSSRMNTNKIVENILTVNNSKAAFRNNTTSSGFGEQGQRIHPGSKTILDVNSPPKTGSTSVPIFDKKKVYLEEQWNDESMWTTVSPAMYQGIVEKARAALDPLVKQVYTDCHIIVSPATFEEKLSDRQSLIKFKCEDIHQDAPCHAAANLCLVVASRQSESGDNFSFGENKTALLMMVDGMDYLLQRNDFAWKSFLNKAAYAYQSNRPFFVWIGRLEDEEHVLHANENESVYHAFGAACDPDFRPGQNTLHYYKGVAIASLFHKQILVPNLSTAFFLDADISFTNDAFLRMKRSFLDERDDSFGPEDYFEISPQASLWGSQNTRGQIVMNGGLLGLRNSSWTHDFCALWWFSRCGHKDQRGKLEIVSVSILS
jgi:hypothetical protein